MQRAIEDVMKKTLAERKAADMYGVKRSTLKRRLREAGQLPDSAELNLLHSGAYNNSAMKIFSAAEEKQLADYCLSASKMGYGLSPIKLRKLSYEFAVKLQKRLPHSRRGRPNPWEVNKLAGQDWLRAFLKRRPELSIRKPEPTSIGRMSAFNRHNVNLFYDNLRTVFTKYGFEPKDIWNCDETGVTTVQVPEHVIAGKGERQVASVTSGERGTLVTMCNAVNACGALIPPFYIFPRVNFKDVFLKNGLPGCVGTAQPTGWMVETTFVKWFNHFVCNVHPSKATPVLLILDNHETHLSIEFIDMAADNGVVVVTIPPHTSHKLQPLDVCVYGPFKRLYNREIDSWLVTNPGKTVSIYDLAEISGKAWSKASMPANVISGFAAAGIHPFQPDKWQDEDFCLAQVTDRPNPQLPENSQPIDHVGVSQADVNPPAVSSTPMGPHATSDHGIVIVTTGRPTDIHEASTPIPNVTPQSIRPLPEAPARQQQRKGVRKKLSSTILTSTPVKESLRKQQQERKEKKGKRKTSKPESNPKQKKTEPKKTKKKSKKLKYVSNGDSDANVLELCNDDDDDDDDDDVEDGTRTRPILRKIVANQSADDKCLVCGEFGRDGEMWYRCRMCARWAHQDCTSATSAHNYVCEYCEDSSQNN
jgi:hypothetical protein